MERQNRPGHPKALIVIYGGLTAAVLFLAWSMNRCASRQWDAYGQMLGAERLHLLGGHIYQTAVCHKGPLWPYLYYVAFQFGGKTACWDWVAVFILVTALAVAVSAFFLVARWHNKSHRPMLALSTLAFLFYLVACGEDWSYRFYSRNISSALTIAGFALAWRAVYRERGRKRYLLGAGALFGQAVLLMPTTGATYLVALISLGLALRAKGRDEFANEPRSSRAVIHYCGLFILASAVSFLAPIVYYAAVGAFTDFWALWFKYNLMYSQSTGLGTREKVAKLFHDLCRYFGQRPISFLVLVSSLAVMGVQYSKTSPVLRIFRGSLVAWLLAELISIGLAQRFFGHYLVLMVVPLGVLALDAAISLLALLPGRKAALPIACFLPLLVLGLSSTGALRKGYEHWQVAVGKNADCVEPEIHDLLMTAQGAVDLLLKPDDFIYTWMRDTKKSAYFGRPFATRYIEKRWLTGHIYGVEKNQNRPLAGTWERWVADMRQANPSVILIGYGEKVPVNSHLYSMLRLRYELLINRPGASKTHPGYQLYALRNLFQSRVRSLTSLSMHALSPPRSDFFDRLLGGQMVLDDQPADRVFRFPSPDSAHISVFNGQVRIGGHGDSPAIAVLPREQDNLGAVFIFRPDGQVLTRRRPFGQQVFQFRPRFRHDRRKERWLPFTIIIQPGSLLLVMKGKVAGACGLGRGELEIWMKRTGNQPGVRNLTFSNVTRRRGIP